MPATQIPEKMLLVSRSLCFAKIDARISGSGVYPKGCRKSLGTVAILEVRALLSLRRNLLLKMYWQRRAAPGQLHAEDWSSDTVVGL